ncbi:hypothetical protein HPP92_029177 [Vanilla planifolia]|uniref:Uncharacterized protein n=1 Tax=Vanilla planifolia TaxID=51239 RepID=A0A835P3D7_VANPL|nr:hypothetical protein HPP92_029177 [Vanilla planifolia]KAG0445774.1 hypothetical protein HPP92_029164 [Vanilla planifolia]
MGGRRKANWEGGSGEDGRQEMSVIATTPTSFTPDLVPPLWELLEGSFLVEKCNNSKITVNGATYYCGVTTIIKRKKLGVRITGRSYHRLFQKWLGNSIEVNTPSSTIPKSFPQDMPNFGMLNGTRGVPKDFVCNPNKVPYLEPLWRIDDMHGRVIRIYA